MHSQELMQVHMTAEARVVTQTNAHCTERYLIEVGRPGLRGSVCLWVVHALVMGDVHSTLKHLDHLQGHIQGDGDQVTCIPPRNQAGVPVLVTYRSLAARLLMMLCWPVLGDNGVEIGCVSASYKRKGMLRCHAHLARAWAVTKVPVMLPRNPKWLCNLRLNTGKAICMCAHHTE